MELKFVQTSICSPEQYDVLDENNNQVAYVRLRSGVLTVDCPECRGVRIHHQIMDLDTRDNFKSETQRKGYLKLINDKILDFYDLVENKIDPEYSEYLEYVVESKTTPRPKIHRYSYYVNHIKDIFKSLLCNTKK